MNKYDPVYQKYEDETGEAYYCPIDAVADNHIVSDWEMDDCVEASTVQRYSGNLVISDRIAS